QRPRCARYRVWNAVAVGVRERAAGEGRQLIQTVITVAGAVGVVEFALRGTDGILLVEGVTVLIVADDKIVSRCAGRGIVPVLLIDTVEAVQAGVLVAGVPGTAGLGNERLVDIVLRMVAFDDHAQPEIVVALQGGRAVRNRAEPANGRVHAGIIVEIEHAP